MDASADTLYFSDVGNRRVRAVDFATGIITTVAGGGTEDIGDGLEATRATFSTHPMRVSHDSGCLYVTDAHQDRIRRVDLASGIITTVAGNGHEAFAGDGGPAAAASLTVPHGARVDRRGNIYIADTRSHRIRKVAADTGIISTVAGDGRERFSGDGMPAVDSSLSGPLSVAVDGEGNLYIADRGNFRVRRVDGSTGIITTVAGTGAPGYLEDSAPALDARFDTVRDVVLGPDGFLYVADGGDNSRICRLDLAEGQVEAVAGSGTPGFSGDGGPAVGARLDHPYSIGLDEPGNLYICDSQNVRVRRVEAQTGVISTLAGTGEVGFSGDGGPATSAALAIGGRRG